MAHTQPQAAFSVNAVRITPTQETQRIATSAATTEPQFNYDLARMQRMVESETVYMPSNLKTADEIMKWLEGKF